MRGTRPTFVLTWDQIVFAPTIHGPRNLRHYDQEESRQYHVCVEGTERQCVLVGAAIPHISEIYRRFELNSEGSINICLLLRSGTMARRRGRRREKRSHLTNYRIRTKRRNFNQRSPVEIERMGVDMGWRTESREGRKKRVDRGNLWTDD